MDSAPRIRGRPHRRAVRSFFFFQAEDGIRDKLVTGVQTCALPIYPASQHSSPGERLRLSLWRRIILGDELVGSERGPARWCPHDPSTKLLPRVLSDLLGESGRLCVCFFGGLRDRGEYCLIL